MDNEHNNYVDYTVCWKVLKAVEENGAAVLVVVLHRVVGEPSLLRRHWSKDPQELRACAIGAARGARRSECRDSEAAGCLVCGGSRKEASEAWGDCECGSRGRGYQGQVTWGLVRRVRLRPFLRVKSSGSPGRALSRAAA